MLLSRIKRLVYTTLLEFDCEKNNVCLCKSRSNLFMEPTSTIRVTLFAQGNTGSLIVRALPMQTLYPLRYAGIRL